MTEWVLVPREPTAKMVLAAFDAITNASGEGMIRARWRCMLDAAPAAPQQAEPVGEVRSETCHYSMMPDRICNKCGRVHGYSHPTAAPQQAGQFDHLAGRGMHELRFDELTPYVLSLLAGKGQDTPDVRIALDWIVSELKRKTNDERALAVKLDAIRAEPQQAEPVAWMAFGGSIVHAVTRNAMDPIEAERFDVPLYLHPPAAPQQAEPALNERVGLAYKNGYEEALNDCIRNGGEAWARSMFANGGEHIKPQQAEPVAWVRNLTDPQPHCVTGLQYRTAADADAGVQYIPVYLHPPAAEVRLQGGLDNEELLEAWRTKVPGVEPTDSDLRAFALGVEFGTRGKRVYFDERNSARDAWRRRVKQCETLEAEVQRLRDALEQIEREANQPYIQRIAAAALKVGE